PPLFLKDEEGSGRLVNYRVKQNYYIVDRLFAQAELRLDDVVVRIDKTQGSTWSRWFSTSAQTTRKSLRRDPDDHGEHHDRADHHDRNGHRM
ncbi:MAG: TrbG/VirB9 family P-type conjugative transfer protein, partial [Geminicoccaceae bacterium]